MVNKSVSLYAQIFNEGSAFLAIHGLFGSGDNLKLLRQLPFRLHLLDLRNHGHSPHHENCSLQAMMDDVLQYMNDQRIESSIVLGHSLGAKIAMKLAVNYPHKVKKLIVVDMAPRVYDVRYHSVFEGMEEVERQSLETRQQVDEILQNYIPKQRLRQFIQKSLRRNNQGKLQWKIAWRFLRDDSVWNHSPINSDQQYEHESCFIYGMNSGFFSYDDHDLVRGHFPKAQIIGIEDSGHWLHSEQPQRFLREVSDFCTAKEYGR